MGATNMSNMDEFNRISALVLAKLYDAFPQGIKISVEEVNETNGEPDKNTIMNFHYTVSFLASENFLKYEGASDEGLFFGEVILTLKGLKVLRSVPDVLEEKQSLGQKVTSLVKGGTKEISKEALKAIINQIFSVESSG
jgi:hypothetical protein